MPRPGFVLEVDSASAPVLFHHGSQLRLERLPAGRSRVVYPPEPVATLVQPAAAVEQALLAPVGGSDPLPARLRAGMRLTVAFDDLSTPVPPMRGPDPRQRIAEAVLDMAAAAGVDDVALVAAIGLRRRMTEGELRHLLGERVHDAFSASGDLVHHDADDPDGLVVVGTTDEGEVVELNRRVAESDLVVHIHVHRPGEAGDGWASLLDGLSSHRTLRGGYHSRMGQVLESDGPPVLRVQATVGDDTSGPLSVLGRREWEWSLRDRATFAAARAGLDILPGRLRQRVVGSWRAPLGITSVHAGDVDSAHAAASAQDDRQHLVPVSGQTDIVTMGLPDLTPLNVGATTNAILARWFGLGCLLGLHRGTPVVRPGGVAILSHPTTSSFDPVHHPSYLDMFEQVLPEVVGADGATDEDRLAEHEEAFATDEWYSHLYRRAYAFHGAHPFGVWREASRALAQLDRVIVVGGDPATVHRLGLRPASTLADALELASDVVGRDASLTHLHSPPFLVAEVS